MEIRSLSAEEMSQARALWEVCFEDHPAFLDWYFRTRFQPQDGLGVFLDGRLLSFLHLSPRKIRLRKRLYPSAYLLALATAPAFRHLGLARALLTYALRHLAANQIFFTFLLPFNIDFYTRLGWGVWADHRLYLLPTAPTVKTDDRCRSPIAPPGSWQFYETNPDHKLLAGIYEQYFATWDGGLVRKDADWTCLLLDHTLDGGKIWLGAPALPAGSVTPSQPVAYALVQPGSPGGGPLLREMAWTDPVVRAAFLQHLTVHYTDPGLVTPHEAGPTRAGAEHSQKSNPESLLPGMTPSGSKGQPCLLTPYHLPGTQPVYLGRVTSVRLALEALTYPPLSTAWTMAVTDPLLPENSGIYHLKLTKGKMEVTKTTGKKPAVHCTVGGLASLITGRDRPQTLIESGALTLLDKDLFTLLNHLFPPTDNFVNEYF